MGNKAASNLPKRLKYVHTADAFKPYEDLNEDDDSDIDESWRDDRDFHALREFEDVSEEERRLLLLWNSFIRTRFTNLGVSVVLTKHVLVDFARVNLKVIKDENLQANLILLFITLYDFGLISNDDVLMAAADVRRLETSLALA